jgi:hypothetical protein
MDSFSPKEAQPPAGFLKVSCEIRQKILCYSFADAQAQDLVSKEFRGRQPYPFKYSNIYAWALVLYSAHPSLSTDLPFVIEQQEAEQLKARIAVHEEYDCPLAVWGRPLPVTMESYRVVVRGYDTIEEDSIEW